MTDRLEHPAKSFRLPVVSDFDAHTPRKASEEGYFDLKGSSYPKESNYPMFVVSGAKNSTVESLGDDKPQLLGTWTLCTSISSIFRMLLSQCLRWKREARRPYDFSFLKLA